MHSKWPLVILRMGTRPAEWAFTGPGSRLIDPEITIRSKYPPAEPGARFRAAQSGLSVSPCPALFSNSAECLANFLTETFTFHLLHRCVMYRLLASLLGIKLSTSSIDGTPLRVLGGSRFGVSSMAWRCRPPGYVKLFLPPGGSLKPPSLFNLLTCTIPKSKRRKPPDAFPRSSAVSRAI
jgi:hypothetical protein